MNQGLVDYPPSGDTVEELFAAHGPERPATYWLLALLLVGAMGCLPFVQVDVSVRAAGWIRPASERTELRPPVAGHIVRILAQENGPVSAGAPVIVLSSREVEEALSRNRARQRELGDEISDLDALLGGVRNGSVPATGTTLSLPALRAEQEQFLVQLASYRLAESKARTELDRYSRLSSKGIATQQELDAARYEVERLAAEVELLVRQNVSRWEARLKERKMALADLASEENRLGVELGRHVVRAPADGVLLGVSSLSVGGFVSAGQTLGFVSPAEALRAELFVSPRDIGFVHVGQPVRLQVDAFPYAQWGMLEGEVESVSGDLLGSGAPGAAGAAAFRIIVRLATTTLHRPNGMTGEIRKGMSLTGRFLVGRRSLLDLLHQQLSDRLDPRAGATPAN